MCNEEPADQEPNSPSTHTAIWRRRFDENRMLKECAALLASNLGASWPEDQLISRTSFLLESSPPKTWPATDPWLFPKWHSHRNTRENFGQTRTPDDSPYPPQSRWWRVPGRGGSVLGILSKDLDNNVLYNVKKKAEKHFKANHR